MSLAVLAQNLASKGRNGDTMLVHMAPSEVAGLQALGLRHGISMTVNPHTGLPEAFSFKSLLKSALPMIAGFALGPAGFGIVSSSLGAAAVVGGVTGLATGSLQKGIMAGLGAYGGAELGGALQGAGLAGAQQAALSGLSPEQIAGRAAFEGLTEQGYKNLLTEQATKDYLSKGVFDRMGAGVSSLISDPAARASALQGIGGTSGLMRAGMMATAPIMADAMVQTATPMPTGQRYQGTIRPYDFNPFTRTWTARPTYPANPVKTEAEPAPDGMNSGGIVALANGGATPEEQVRQAYAGIGRQGTGNLVNQIDPEGFNYWTQQLQTGAIKPEDFQSKFMGAVNQYIAEKPNDAVSQYVRNYMNNPGAIDQTQLARPTAAQLAAQQSILDDPEAAALAAAKSGLAAGMTDQQIADMVNMQYGKTFSAQNVADFMKAKGLTRTPVFDVTPTPDLFPGTTPGVVTTGEPLTPVAPTMSEVKSAYEKGGGSTKMPTITDIKPTDKTYTQNEAFALLQGYLKTNPNASYGDVVAFARGRGIPDMQARAAYNEFRFSGMTGDTKAAYDYLMGRGAYPTGTVNRPVMRPYAEAMGLSGANRFAGTTQTTPTTPSKETAQGAGTTTGTAKTTGSAGATGVGVTGGIGSLSGTGGKGSTTNMTGVDTTKSTDASTVGGVVVGNNVIDPISGGVLGVVTANVDQGTGGIIQGDVIIDPITGKIIGYTDDSGLIARLVNKKIGEELAPIESRYVPSDTAYYDFGQGDIGGYGGSYTQEEMDMMAGMRKGGLADVAAMSAAQGGDVQRYNLGGYSDGGRLLRGPGDGVSDSIPATIGNKQPARLADGEFVIPARIVSEIGNGSTEAGARKLYAMMDRVQRARAKTTGKGKVAKNTNADKYLPA